VPGFQDRMEKAREIASVSSSIEQISDSAFAVSSQSSFGSLPRKVRGGALALHLPGFSSASDDCKHVLAVRLHLEGPTLWKSRDFSPKQPRPTYRQEWHSYNEGQKAELRLFDVVLR